MPLLQPPSPELRHDELTYTHAYNSIVSRVRRSGGSGSGGVVIFVGVDVVSVQNFNDMAGKLTKQDGLLAARILASLFRQDDIPYRLVPVGGYSELEQRRDEAFASEEVSPESVVSQCSIIASHAHPPFLGITLAPVVLLYFAKRMSPTHHRFTSSLEPAKSIRDRCGLQ